MMKKANVMQLSSHLFAHDHVLIVCESVRITAVGHRLPMELVRGSTELRENGFKTKLLVRACL